jgi:hypothetical protein
VDPIAHGQRAIHHHVRQADWVAVRVGKGAPLGNGGWVEHDQVARQTGSDQTSVAQA